MVLLVIGRFLASLARKAAKRGRADDEQDSDGGAHQWSMQDEQSYFIFSMLT
jgi:hypothetical protein